jgi:hypothetical protein
MVHMEGLSKGTLYCTCVKVHVPKIDFTYVDDYSVIVIKNCGELTTIELQ